MNLAQPQSLITYCTSIGLLARPSSREGSSYVCNIPFRVRLDHLFALSTALATTQYVFRQHTSSTNCSYDRLSPQNQYNVQARPHPFFQEDQDLAEHACIQCNGRCLSILANNPTYSETTHSPTGTVLAEIFHVHFAAHQHSIRIADLK